MKKLIESIKEMSKFDKVYAMVFLAIIVGCSIITGQHSDISVLGLKLDSFYVSLLASVIGVVYVVNVRLAKKSSMVLGVLFSLLYCVLAFSNKNYGDTVVNLYCAVICFMGFVNWSKASKGNDKIEVRDLDKKQSIKLFIISVIVYAFAIFTLNALGTNNLYIDSAIFVIVIFANTLMSLRYRQMWVMYNLLNGLHCVLWAIRIYEGVPNAIPVFIMFVCYLINSLLATKQWYKKN